MKERPILFNGSMVRAILGGRKTQTRRVADTGLYAIDGAIHGTEVAERERAALLTRCRYGQPGDHLWVRESFSFHEASNDSLFLPPGTPGEALGAHYWADGNPEWGNWDKPKPSIHMPRRASRITLEITAARIERLQDITEEDAKAEGLTNTTKDGQLYKWGIPDRDGWPGTDDDGWPWAQWDADPRQAFRRLWDSIYGSDPAKCWDANPWVWVTAFGRSGNADL